MDRNRKTTEVSLKQVGDTMASLGLNAGTAAVVQALTDGEAPTGKAPSVVRNAVGIVVGDWVSEFRTRRLMSLITKTARVAETHGLDPSKLQQLPHGERYKLLDAATRDDDPVIEDMWVSLLLHDLDEEDNRTRFVKLLEGMTGDDARVLTFLKCAEPLGKALEMEAQEYDDVVRRGFEGDNRSKYRRTNVPPYKSEGEFNAALKAADGKRKSLALKLQALETELIAASNGYNARDALLRAGLIQIRVIDLPESIDNVHTISVPSRYSDFSEEGSLNTCDPDAVMAAIECLHNLIAQHTGYNRTDTDQPELIDYKSSYNVCPWQLTPLGERLYEVCALRAKD